MEEETLTTPEQETPVVETTEPTVQAPVENPVVEPETPVE